jgi:hypothetical protein
MMSAASSYKTKGEESASNKSIKSSQTQETICWKEKRCKKNRQNWIKVDKESHPGPQPRGRPAFSKPTREVKVRHLETSMKEFCSLNFDEVDAAQQKGLTNRRLVLIKSLGDTLTFWDIEEKEKKTAQAFTLLGLEESDMFALAPTLKEALKLIDEHRYRDAFNKLTTLSPWFEASDEKQLEVQRSELRKAAKLRDLPIESVSSEPPKEQIRADVCENCICCLTDKEKIRYARPWADVTDDSDDDYLEDHLWQIKSQNTIKPDEGLSLKQRAFSRSSPSRLQALKRSIRVSKSIMKVSKSANKASKSAMKVSKSAKKVSKSAMKVKNDTFSEVEEEKNWQNKWEKTTKPDEAKPLLVVKNTFLEFCEGPSQKQRSLPRSKSDSSLQAKATWKKYDWGEAKTPSTAPYSQVVDENPEETCRITRIIGYIMALILAVQSGMPISSALNKIKKGDRKLMLGWLTDLFNNFFDLSLLEEKKYIFEMSSRFDIDGVPQKYPAGRVGPDGKYQLKELIQEHLDFNNYIEITGSTTMEVVEIRDDIQEKVRKHQQGVPADDMASRSNNITTFRENPLGEKMVRILRYRDEGMNKIKEKLQEKQTKKLQEKQTKKLDRPNTNHGRSHAAWWAQQHVPAHPWPAYDDWGWY